MLSQAGAFALPRRGAERRPSHPRMNRSGVFYREPPINSAPAARQGRLPFKPTPLLLYYNREKHPHIGLGGGRISITLFRRNFLR